MFLDYLIKELEKERIKIGEVPPSEVKPENIPEPSSVKGKIAETMVRKWLLRCQNIEFDQDFPRRANGYHLKQNSSGIIVSKNKRTKHEYDFLVFYEGRPVIIEVKSFRLKGVESKIPRAIKLGREIYQTDNLGMLLFFPFYCNKQKDAFRIKRNFPLVRCANLGYKKKQLNNAMRKFYASLS